MSAAESRETFTSGWARKLPAAVLIVMATAASASSACRQCE
jgi:hypothetical protein